MYEKERVCVFISSGRSSRSKCPVCIYIYTYVLDQEKHTHTHKCTEEVACEFAKCKAAIRQMWESWSQITNAIRIWRIFRSAKLSFAIKWKFLRSPASWKMHGNRLVVTVRLQVHHGQNRRLHRSRCWCSARSAGRTKSEGWDAELIGVWQNGFGSDSLRCQIHWCFSCIAHVYMCSREMPCCPEILNERMQLVADDLRLLMVLCLDQEDASTSYFA